MKHILGALLFLIFLHSANAETKNTEIIKIETIEGESLIFAGDGAIYETSTPEVLSAAKSALELRRTVKLELLHTSNLEDVLGNRNIVSKIIIQSEKSSFQKTTNTPNQKDNYDPTLLMSTYITDVDTFEQANQLFKTMRTRMRRKSQCYNRAHVWAWELHRNFIEDQRVQVGKMWLFFTKKYIRNYNYKWWFHITPYLNNNGKALAMDRSYTRGPVETKQWTDIFIQSRENCTEVNRYTDYENFQNSGDCFIIKTSVHYWQPWHIENLEKKGQSREDWQQFELKKAYKNAVGWRARVPKL